MATKETDRWLLDKDGNPDPFAANIDWNMPDLPDPDEPLSGEDPVLAPVLDPEVIGHQPPVEPEPQPDPEPEGPEVVELEDGSVLTLDKDKGQWKGVVETAAGGKPQVFWGKTKNELITNLLKAQANATKKIREQNAKLKLENVPVKPKPQPVQQPTQPRRLTAEETFEYETLHKSDPAAAIDFLMLKTRGVTLDQLMNTAQEAKQTASFVSNQLDAEAVNKTFLQNNPDYYPDPEYTNYSRLVKWIAKFKLGESIPKGQEVQFGNKLISAGVYTVENLEEAFEDLSNDDLLIKAPKSPQTVVQPIEPPPAPRPDSRIVSQVTRPRAALGIGRNDVTPVKPPETPKAPSAEDLNELSDTQVASLMAAIRRERAMGRRS